MIVVVEKARDAVVVRLPGPDRDLISIVKSVPGYSWSDATKAWRYPLDADAVQELLLRLRAQSAAQVAVRPAVTDWLAAARERMDRAIAVRENGSYPMRVPQARAMYAFQRQGAGFLIEAKRAILGDEMGLGKTIEAIGAVCELKDRGLISQDARILVVCPKSVMYAWRTELRTWADEEATILTHCRELEGKKTPEGWYTINWQKLPVREQKLTKVPWDVIVADESHRAKNRNAKQTKSLHRLSADYKFALTGTPIRNDVTDLWAQFHWVDPARFPSFWKFFDLHADFDLEFFGRREVKKVTGIRDEAKLNKVMRTVLFGRKIDDVEIELPPIVGPKTITVDLEGDQLKAYVRMRDEFVSWLEEAPEDEVLARNWMAQLIRLKQLAGSLGIFWPDRHESAKLDAMEELGNEIDEKFVIFSQFETMTRQAEHRLRLRREAYALLTGPRSLVWGPNRGEVLMDRGDVVDTFQKRDQVRWFLATTTTGGEGITLTAARRVAFLDELWTPAEQEQAWKRIHRIGQTKTCFVYRILARNTVDFSVILPTLRRKEDIINVVMAGAAK